MLHLSSSLPSVYPSPQESSPKEEREQERTKQGKECSLFSFARRPSSQTRRSFPATTFPEQPCGNADASSPLARSRNLGLRDCPGDHRKSHDQARSFNRDCTDLGTDTTHPSGSGFAHARGISVLHIYYPLPKISSSTEA